MVSRQEYQVTDCLQWVVNFVGDGCCQARRSSKFFGATQHFLEISFTRGIMKNQDDPDREICRKWAQRYLRWATDDRRDAVRRCGWRERRRNPTPRPYRQDFPPAYWSLH